MKDNYYLDIILKGYEESLSAIQFEETFATFESRSTLLNMGSTKYTDAEFYQKWINSDTIKTLIERIGKDEFINYEAKSRVEVEAWGKLANFFDRQQKITEREYFITNTDFFKNCLNIIDKLILNLKKIDGNTESIFYYEGVQGSLTDSVGKGFPYCNEINSFVFIRWHIKNTLKNAYKIEQDLLTPQKPQQPENTPLTLSDTTKNKHGIIRALTNEIYYEVIIEGHRESLDAFTCSYKDAEYDHEHTVELFNDPRLGYEKQFKTLDDFILYRKQSTLDHKAYYRFWLYIESRQKIFERDYFVNEINFYIRCIDAISIKIDLEIEKYTNFIPLSKRGENGGVITNGNRFNRLVDSLVYYRIHFEDRVNSLNNNILLESIKTTEPLDLSDTSTVEKNRSKKLLVEFIHNVKDKETFLQELKTTFTTEKGKSIKIIITLLKKESILIINSREFKDFHLELESFFDRNIGTRQSVNDVIFDDIHPEIIEPIQKRLNPLVLKHKAI